MILAGFCSNLLGSGFLQKKRTLTLIVSIGVCEAGNLETWQRLVTLMIIISLGACQVSNLNRTAGHTDYESKH